MGAQWLRGRVFDSRSRGCGFEPRRRTALCPCAKHIKPCLVLVQACETRPDMAEN